MNKDQFQFEPTKKAFLNTWPGGYRENFEVFQKQCGASEQEVVDICLRPHFHQGHSALEVGCGGMFWVENYLLPNFRHVYAIDLIPATDECVTRNSGKNFSYIEAGDRDYSLSAIPDNSIDFVWSFGVFCHLPLFASEAYAKSIFRVLKPGGTASLFYSNTDRRPGSGSKMAPETNPDSSVFWCENNWETTEKMLREVGFVDAVDLMPNHCNTMAGLRKP